jgi:hypothetical protein
MAHKFKKPYLLVVVGDVEPKLSGPYKDEATRDAAAKAYREKDSEMCDGVYRLDMIGANLDGIRLAVDSFGGGEL